MEIAGERAAEQKRRGGTQRGRYKWKVPIHQSSVQLSFFRWCFPSLIQITRTDELIDGSERLRIDHHRSLLWILPMKNDHHHVFGFCRVNICYNFFW
jgi:hypothetical protein